MMDQQAEEAGEGAYEPERNAKGRFRKGSSGNPNGRPRKHPERHRMPMHNARAAIEVAEMPVQMTIDGETVEITAYKAVLRKLFQMAMAGNMTAMKRYLDETNAAAATSRYHSELVQLLSHSDADEQARLKKILELFPEPQNSGTWNMLPDGTSMPAKWYDSIQKLKQLEEMEAELRKREEALRLREMMIDTQGHLNAGSSTTQ